MSAALTRLAADAEAVPYHQSLGVRVETLTAEHARLRVPYRDENSNPGRALHGGVAASLIDIAGVLAARAGGPDGGGVESGTLDLSVDYLAAAIGEDIVADAQVLRRGKEIVYVDVDVRNDAGKRIAKGLVTHRLAAASPPERLLSVPAEPPAEATGAVPPMARALVALPFIAGRGMRITLMDGGRSTVEMPGGGANRDHDDRVHEGAIAALLDTTGAMAAWSVVGLDLRYKASTIGIHVSFHAPARAEDVVGRGRTLRRTNEVFLNAVTVVGRASGQMVAAGTVTYRIVVPE
jgi:uncharacterized protein (TIGR00369 family)